MTQAASAEIARRANRRPAASGPEISLDEADVINLFIALATQWQRAGMSGIRVGLDYAAIAPTAALLGIAAVTPAMFHDLRVLEDAALVEWAGKA